MDTGVCRVAGVSSLAGPEGVVSHASILGTGVLRASILNIPRFDVKGVAVELVNDAIKHAFLTLGYAAATSDQDKAVREFLEGMWDGLASQTSTCNRKDFVEAPQKCFHPFECTCCRAR